MKRIAVLVVLVWQIPAFAGASPDHPAASLTDLFPPWLWAAILFVFCFVLGILAILAGVGVGVLFVPLVGTFFPFHMDFVRGASLFVALAGSLSASSGLLHRYLASTRLVFPMAFLASSAAVFGAMVGLAIPEHIIRVLLGVLIVLISVLMLLTRRSEFPETGGDALSRMLGISGSYYEHALGKVVEWKGHRTLLSMFLFLIIGFIAGMFGIGAGWANVPVLNLIMGVPLKVSVGSSLFLISIGSTASSWIYLNAGAVLPLITVPSVLGMILGSRIGVRILDKTEPRRVRRLVIGLLALSGIMSLLRGLGIL